MASRPEDAERIAALEKRVRELERERASLVEGENRLRTILDILPVGVWFTDSFGKIELGNPAAKRVWAGARFVGVEQYGEYKGWWADTGKLIEAEEWALARALRGETSLDEVVDIECFDGTRKTIINSAVPVRDAEGAIAGAVVLNVDISGPKQTERRLQAAMQRLRFHSDNSPLAVVEWSADFRVLAWNAAAERLFGWSAGEALGRGMAELQLVHPDDLAEVEEVSAAMVDGRRPSNVHANRNLRRDGTVIHCEWYNSALHDSEGRLESVLSLVLDVTARRQAAEAVRVSEAMATARANELQAVLDTVPAAVWIARDPRGDRIDANRFGSELLGQPVGSNLSVTAPLEERPVNFRPVKDGVPLTADTLPIQAAARFGKEIRDFEFDVLFDDGRKVHMLGNAAPLLDGAGEPRGSVGAFIDTTERKRAEEELREADRRKTDFLAVLSHELRNPLAPIRNSIFVLDRAPPGSDVALRARDALHRQTEHLSRLVDDLLDITRITHGKIELQLSRIDAREAVRKGCDDVRAVFEQRGVELHVSEAADPAWVDADAARLTQIVGNLLNNALKFTQPGGRVHVTVRRRPGVCEVSVRDNGMGIDAADLERIFEPFVQAERTRRGAQGGMGIGLALVRELAARHGGSVVATSAGPGKGAEFVVTLPLAAPAERAEVGASLGAAPGGLSVLIVEDNEDAGASLADLLALSGYEATVVGTGRAGVEAVAARPPDVLICDVGLPDLSGHEVIRAIRAGPDGRSLFAIALTGYAQPRDREEALAAGFDAHLPKPPPIEQLNALLERVAAGRAAR
jgi:PAS domain S-box-containing protein